MNHLHSRIIDVSELFKGCADAGLQRSRNLLQRRLLLTGHSMILKSTKELQFYRNNVFKKKTDEEKRKG